MQSPGNGGREALRVTNHRNAFLLSLRRRLLGILPWLRNTYRWGLREVLRQVYVERGEGTQKVRRPRPAIVANFRQIGYQNKAIISVGIL